MDETKRHLNAIGKFYMINNFQRWSLRKPEITKKHAATICRQQERDKDMPMALVKAITGEKPLTETELLILERIEDAVKVLSNASPDWIAHLDEERVMDKDNKRNNGTAN